MYTDVSNAMPLPDRVATLLAESWSNRVAVKVGHLDPSQYYDPDIPDYPPELVPFRADPRYLQLDEATRRKLLAAAWVAYNEKTIDVELSVVSPACVSLLRGDFEGLDGIALKRIITQTQVDEQYHTLMCLDACLLTRKMHGIERLRIPQSLVVAELKRAMARQTSPRDAQIVQIGFATVAEVTINSYLGMLSNAENIQPFNRETTALHRRDELSHNKIFRTFAVHLYPRLDDRDRGVFREAIATGLDAFVQVDLGAWREILQFLDVPDAADIVEGFERSNASRRMVRDFSGLRDLLRDIGVAEAEIAFDFG
jgi:alpha-N-dichloroacetyl-p-aminophenylserinol N-oxygenase